jgi:hypothetical protein
VICKQNAGKAEDCPRSAGRTAVSFMVRCAFGAQLERPISDVSKDLLLVVVLDDLANKPRREYLRVLQFLGVQDDRRSEFPFHIKARIPRPASHELCSP